MGKAKTNRRQQSSAKERRTHTSGTKETFPTDESSVGSNKKSCRRQKITYGLCPMRSLAASRRLPEFQQSRLELELRLNRGLQRANDLDCRCTPRRRKAFRCACRTKAVSFSSVIGLLAKESEHCRHYVRWIAPALPAGRLTFYWSDPARHLSNTMLKPGGLILYGRSSPAFQGGETGHPLRRLSIVISFSVGGSEAY